MLRKGVYPQKHMDSQQKLIGTSFPDKTESYNNLTMEEITDADYKLAKRLERQWSIKFRRVS